MVETVGQTGVVSKQPSPFLTTWKMRMYIFTIPAMNMCVCCLISTVHMCTVIDRDLLLGLRNQKSGLQFQCCFHLIEPHTCSNHKHFLPFRENAPLGHTDKRGATPLCSLKLLSWTGSTSFSILFCSCVILSNRSVTINQ